MSSDLDFERRWLNGFADSVHQLAGTEIRDAVMLGSEDLLAGYNGDSVIQWTGRAVERLGALVDESRCREILMRCACRYPSAALRQVRDAYEQEGDIDAAQRMLQDQFEALLRDSLGLEEKLIGEVVEKGWGSAGVRRGSTIFTTKIPKSGNLLDYLLETDPLISLTTAP